MNIANHKALEISLVVVFCIAPSWAQKSDKNNALTRQMAAASTPAPASSSGSSGMMVRDSDTIYDIAHAELEEPSGGNASEIALFVRVP